MLFGPGLHLSIDRSTDMKSPSLAWYTHSVSIVCQIGSRVAFVPAAKRKHHSPMPILGKRQAQRGTSVEQWVGKAAARAFGCAEQGMFIDVGNNVIPTW